MNSHNIAGRIIQVGVLCLGPLLAGVIMALLAGPTPVQAAAGMAQPNAALKSGAIYTRTVFLPILAKTPSPEYQLIDLINAERIRRGLSPLRVSPILIQTAEAHSQDMVDRKFFDHTTPDGQTPGNRLTEAGYAYWSCGENIGAGYTTEQAMFTGWMESPYGHRELMLDPDFTEIGVGFVTGGPYGYYWTADFAKPR